MDIRMLPIRHVFERFPRLVRDLARQQGKEIELILEGEATRIDKAIIDEIGEPLVHLIRNSVDHGIETPAVRVARGKTPTGTILLSAAQESNHVLITIMDDGAGIDAQRGAPARRWSAACSRRDESLSERELVQLIFSQGFSTAEPVSELSGRGVGLDVVLKSIERLNGLVEVETVPGVGTKFIIQLPLTLAIISALLVEVVRPHLRDPARLGGGEPQAHAREEIHRINGRETLRIRDRIVPLMRLADFFGLPEAHGRPSAQYAVILGRGDKRVGLVVDRLRGQQEVVIKALDPAVAGRGASGMAGATIMGDGRVVLILDVAALFEGRRHSLVLPGTTRRPRCRRRPERMHASVADEPQARTREAAPRRAARAGAGLDRARRSRASAEPAPGRPARRCPPPAWPRTSWPSPRPAAVPAAAPAARAPAAPDARRPTAAPRAPQHLLLRRARARGAQGGRRPPSTWPPSSWPARSTASTCAWCRRSSASREITPVPRAPEFIKGVINLRGRIIPVVDLKRKLGLGEVDGRARQSRIVVVKVRERLIGLLVDGASQVLKVPVSTHRAGARRGGRDRRQLHPRRGQAARSG